MVLLISVCAAVVATIVWYLTLPEDSMRLSTLCMIYWGASVMWFVDAVAEYIRVGSEYFNPTVETMINDTFLGLAVVVLGLVIWLIRLLITDPRQMLSRAKHD